MIVSAKLFLIKKKNNEMKCRCLIIFCELNVTNVHGTKSSLAVHDDGVIGLSERFSSLLFPSFFLVAVFLKSSLEVHDMICKR